MAGLVEIDDQGLRVKVTGVVQGVGFRPFVYRLAESLRLKGRVFNSSGTVTIEVEGEERAKKIFLERLLIEAPALSRIDTLEVEEVPAFGYADFSITASVTEEGSGVMVPPDTAICPDCLGDLQDPKSRYFGYPFLNCTACGPRFTILRALPYDRKNTSMAGFPLCPGCEREYSDPSNRRFHAQPTACKECGPRLFLEGPGRGPGVPLVDAGRLLREGKILAVKGQGGYHLACSATDGAAVRRLRERKGRPAKPLAVMMRDLETVRRYCRVSPEEAAWLKSPRAPIVVLEAREGTDLAFKELAPNLKTLGVMLPYTPLHLLLLRESPRALVMTSGNLSGLPLEIDDDGARERLGRVADAFLLYDREIVNRCDDSVLEVLERDRRPILLRRSRGFVPDCLPVEAPRPHPVILGLGGDMNGTVCFLKDGKAFLSQHLGDMDSLEGRENRLETVARWEGLLGDEVQLTVRDAHPGYDKAAFGEVLEVQHHHAHMAAVMAEHGLDGSVVGAILDGTGYGNDGRLWGFEILTGDYLSFERSFHLDYIPLPGGERAIREPWRTGVALLVESLESPAEAIEEVFEGRPERGFIAKLLRRGFNCPEACGAGRLFDGVSAIAGVCRESTYEGQAAIELGELVRGTWYDPTEAYPFEIRADVFDYRPLVRALLADLKAGVDQRTIARRFHGAVAGMVVDGVRRAATAAGAKDVVLGGGVFANPWLLGAVMEGLRDFRVYRPFRVPPGDGGLSLGQAVIGLRRWEKSVSGYTGKGRLAERG